MYKKIKGYFKNKEYIYKDIMFLIGCIIILATNFNINIYFGLYSLGLSFILFSIFLNLTKKVGDKR